MKGAKVDIIFPKEVYDYLKAFCLKMQTIPAIHPHTGQQIQDPKTGKMRGMSKTGTVEELVHISILSAVFPMIAQNPEFLAEQMQLQKIAKIYSDYLETLGDKNTTTKKG